MRTFCLLIVFWAGCYDYKKLSSADGGIEQVDVGVMPESDFAGVDLAGTDIILPPEIDAGADLAEADLTSAPDMTQAPTDMAKPCVTTLANIGTGDFTIRFRITTTASVMSTVMYQRADCNLPTSDYWQIRMVATGVLEINAGNGDPSPTFATHQIDINTTISGNNGAPHDIVVSRTAGILSTTTDGVASSSLVSVSASFRNLPPLGIASGDPCEGADGTMPLIGTVTNVCITR